MAQQIHGHKVLDILSAQSFSRDDHKSNVVNQYGVDVQFHTCKTDGLDFDSLFDFFIKMGKITDTDGQFSYSTENSCEH